MRENIELLLREFGAERVLFGLGFKSHYGAPIAGLAFANITPIQREFIAHANAQRLLGLDPAKIAADGNVAEKPLWDKARRGESPGVPIIDAHAHAGPTTRGWYFPDNDFKTQLSNIVKRMDKLGVDEIYISGSHALFGDCVPGNKVLEEMAAPHKGRIFGYLSFNPLYANQLINSLDDFFSRDFFRGFKILASYWKVPVTEPDYIPVWEYADKHSLPMLLHTWNGSYDSPAMLTDIAPKYPNAKFLLGHSGGGTGGRAEAVKLSKDNPNVFLEFCGSFTTDVDWVDTIDAVGLDKIIFGSDADAHDEAWELGRLLSIPIPDDKLLPTLSENFKKIISQRR
jgi:predicted TIM-barrel fold metal-dependent hydrolase